MWHQMCHSCRHEFHKIKKLFFFFLKHVWGVGINVLKVPIFFATLHLYLPLDNRQVDVDESGALNLAECLGQCPPRVMHPHRRMSSM